MCIRDSANGAEGGDVGRSRRVGDDDLAVQTGGLEALDEVAVASDDPGPLEPCLLYTSPSPRDRTRSRKPSSA